MLILVVGGAFQGKCEFAKSFDMPVINGLQLEIRKMMEEMSYAEELKNRSNEVDYKSKSPSIDYTDSIRESINEKILNIAKEHKGVIVSDEIGCGIIPAEKFERDYRELTGRILCDIAKMADEVYKVEAGIAAKIKGYR